MGPRQHAAAILLAGIEAVDPRRLVVDALGSGEVDSGDVLVLAVGKAATAMAQGAREALGDRTRGIVVAPEATPIPGFESLIGEHPVPGPGSFLAGARLLDAAHDADADHTVLVLLSGGASALAEHPAPGIDQNEIAERTATLLRSGRDIAAINQERIAWSAIKGGRLAAAARPARVVTLAISDVPGAAPAMIGSGPTIGGDALRVIADGSTAVQGAITAAAALGLEAAAVAEPLIAPADAVARMLATTRLETGVLVGHGEPTVQVTGPGRGGRAQHVALNAAIEVAGRTRVVGAIGTDGIDGSTENAGAIVDGTTTARGAALGLDAGESLSRCDSAGYLEAVGDVIVTGRTGTNVADLFVVVDA
jgi:hydroxypyruvate reductase